jgi:hypothetical protein
MRSPFGSLNIRHALDGMARQFRRNFGSQSPPSVAALRERDGEFIGVGPGPSEHVEPASSQLEGPSVGR